MRIFDWMVDWQGSGKYRAILPAIGLSRLGHDCVVAAELDAESRFVEDCDLMMVHRANTGFMHHVFQTLATGPRTTQLILDLDDDVWNVPKQNDAHGFTGWSLIEDNVRAADYVSVPSQGLADLIAEKGGRPLLFPNAVPDELLDFPRPPSGFEGVSLGYTSGTSHRIDVPILKDVLPLAMAPDMRLVLIGKMWHLGVPPEQVEWRKWRPWLADYYYTLDFDIGLAPLSLEHRFNWGKSNLKCIEYMARGIPWVASAAGPYLELSALHGKAGYLVQTRDEWVDALRALGDPALRARMGAYGLDWVRRHRTISVVGEMRERALNLRRGEISRFRLTAGPGTRTWGEDHTEWGMLPRWKELVETDGACAILA